MKVQISVDFVVSVPDGTDTNAFCINLDYENVSIETVSGELVDGEILGRRTCLSLPCPLPLCRGTPQIW